MRQTLSIILFALVLLLGGAAFAVDNAANTPAIDKYEALLADGVSEIEALQAVLNEFGGDAEQVSAVIARAAADTGDPGSVVAVSICPLITGNNSDSIGSAMDAALAQTSSTEQATQVAAQAMAAVCGDGAGAELAQQAITNSALANNVDPGALLESTAALGESGDGGEAAERGRATGPPAGGDGGSAPGGSSGGGGGVGSLS